VTRGISILTSVAFKYADNDYIPTENMPKVLPEYKEKAMKRILRAASAEFAHRGYRNTTMNDIAKRMGVSKGALYQYFSGKDALLAAIADSYVEREIKRAISASRKEGSTETPASAFGGILTSMPRWYPTMICEFISDAHLDEDAQKRAMAIPQRITDIFSKYLEDRRIAGEIQSDVDTEMVASGLVALQLGLVALIASGFPRSQAVEIWTEMVERLGRGLQRRT
jgi:AcrR family transcriptional regulator